jgi:hypothetical protein
MPATRRAFAQTLSSLVPGMAALAVLGGGQSAEAADEPAPAVDRKALEKKLAAQLTGAIFEGQFTVDGKAGKPPAAEKYTITRAVKLAGDSWLIETRIEYGGKDVTVPITLDILWAGDTPVITLTELMIPKLGTFSSRVVIHGDRYAGTWQHDAVGGHLFGKIIPKAS